MENAGIVNDYGNTEELIKKFPVINPTPVYTKMEERIQNRLLTGFENWNRGYEAWEAWGDILYTPESIYNVHSVKLSLKSYQLAMKATLRANDIQMGDFKNMVICGDWTAIHYEIATINRETGEVKPGSVMEFVHFGDSEELGCRVIEGWAGTRGSDFSMLSRIQEGNLKEEQDALLNRVVNTVLPATEDLEEKYPVIHPTPVRDETGSRIRQILLESFEAYNAGAESWSWWLKENYASSFQMHTDVGDEDLDAYIESETEKLAACDRKKVFFDSMLISGNWAAIHYRFRTEDKNSGEKQAGDAMEFIRFEEKDGQLKPVESYIK